jgi:hypothetical protein
MTSSYGRDGRGHEGGSWWPTSDKAPYRGGLDTDSNVLKAQDKDVTGLDLDIELQE